MAVLGEAEAGVEAVVCPSFTGVVVPAILYWYLGVGSQAVQAELCPDLALPLDIHNCTHYYNERYFRPIKGTM